MGKRICVVGAGYWGRNHIKTLFKMGCLKGIVETDKRNLDLISKFYDDAMTYANIEESFEDSYDGYIIATPSETHYTLSKKIISLGNNVLIEKPMTLSIEDAREIKLLSEKKNVSVMVGHVLLFHPAIKKIKEMINNNTIGNLQYIYSNRLNLGKIRMEENVFWSFAPHDIAIFQFLTDDYPINIQASGSTFVQEGIHDLTMTNLEYSNGVKGHIFVSWLHPFKEHRLVVIGSEAMIVFEDSKNDKPLTLFSKKFDLSTGIPEKIDGEVKQIIYDKKMPLEAELEYFLNHLDGKKPRVSNVSHGLDTVKILVNASKQLIE